MTSPKDYIQYMIIPKLVELSLMANLDELKEINKPISKLWRKYHPLKDLKVVDTGPKPKANKGDKQ